MQLISKFNERIRFLLCLINIFSKYALVIPLKDKKSVTTVNVLQNILNSSKREPNKIQVDKDSEFYNSSYKKWLKDNETEMYSTHNEGKSVVSEKIIRLKFYRVKSANTLLQYQEMRVLMNRMIY